MEKFLTELAAGEEGTITAVYGGKGLRSRLRRLGLVKGQHVRKLSDLALGGPVVVLVNRTQVAIGRGMANKITVSIQ
jgi:ferrous iron transport protein A